VTSIIAAVVTSANVWLRPDATNWRSTGLYVSFKSVYYIFYNVLAFNVAYPYVIRQ